MDVDGESFAVHIMASFCGQPIDSFQVCQEMEQATLKLSTLSSQLKLAVLHASTSSFKIIAFNVFEEHQVCCSQHLPCAPLASDGDWQSEHGGTCSGLGFFCILIEA